MNSDARSFWKSLCWRWGDLQANVALTLITMEGFLKTEGHGVSLRYYHRLTKERGQE